MKNEIIIRRLSALRAQMKLEGIEAFLVPTEDFHSSEYVGDYFKCRQFLTGFTGSAGTALITMDMAGLWTDGRYFLQAERELDGTGILLFRAGEEGVLSIEEYLETHLFDGQILGLDGRTVSERKAEELEKRLLPKGVRIRKDLDLVGAVWPDRPALSFKPVWELELKWAGRSRTEKMAEVRKAMEESRTDYFLLSSLDDIAWLLNLRGDDIPCNPVFLSYLVVAGDEAFLFAGEEAFPDPVRESLAKDGVHLLPYSDFYSWLCKLPSAARVLLDKDSLNSRSAGCLPGTVEVIDQVNPTVRPKACKNPVEVENIRQAHLKDGVSVTRFIMWLKKNAASGTITELSAAEKLYSLRSMQEGFLGNSFHPIIAYADHGAVIHYSADEETNVVIRPCGMVLADTGGQYFEGTTDITRTFSVGETTREEKEYFTRVLLGHLRLMNAVFRRGMTGSHLDILARSPLWETGSDYNHGTGHGVGYCLNVHEGPQRIHWDWRKASRKPVPFEEGMITSCEPGFYKPGEFGIRHENLLVCLRADDLGKDFLRFEPLTLVPFDLDMVDPGILGEEGIRLLNSYHQRVFRALSPLMSDEEREWLRDASRAIRIYPPDQVISDQE